MGSWAPVLPRSTGLGQRAWDAVLALGNSLLAQADAGSAGNRSAPLGCDEAVLLAYLSLADQDPRWRRGAIRRLNAGVDGVDALCATGRWGLHGGLAGLGWVVEHVALLLGAGEEADLNRDTDAALLRELQRGRWRGSCDLEDGLVGLGVYFLERLPRRSAAGGVALVAAHLESLSSLGGPQSLWAAGSELDVCRGMPGMIHFLSEAAASGIEEALSLRLLEGAAGWLMAHQGSAASPGWSGDLGTAAVFFQVARRTGRADFLEFARRLLDCSLEASASASAARCETVRGAAAGVAHAFGRIYKEDADPRCLAGALVWLERTVELLPEPAEGGPGGEERRGRGLLDGATGVALALLAATTPAEPEWDRRILLSGRPAGPAARPDRTGGGETR